eukprot:gene8243-9795_t
MSTASTSSEEGEPYDTLFEPEVNSDSTPIGETSEITEKLSKLDGGKSHGTDACDSNDGNRAFREARADQGHQEQQRTLEREVLYATVSERIAQQVDGIEWKYDVAKVLAAFGVDVQAYRKAALQFHPDRNVGRSAEERMYNEEAWKLISTAMDGYSARPAQHSIAKGKSGPANERSKRGSTGGTKLAKANPNGNPNGKKQPLGPGFWRAGGINAKSSHSQNGVTGGGRGIWDS